MVHGLETAVIKNMLKIFPGTGNSLLEILCHQDQGFRVEFWVRCFYWGWAQGRNGLVSVSLDDCILTTDSEAAVEVNKETGRWESSVCLQRDFRGRKFKGSWNTLIFKMFETCIVNVLPEIHQLRAAFISSSSGLPDSQITFPSSLCMMRVGKTSSMQQPPPNMVVNALLNIMSQYCPPGLIFCYCLFGFMFSNKVLSGLAISQNHSAGS